MALIETEEAALRLARAIASDLFEYNKDKIAKGIQEDNFYDALAEQIDEGRTLFKSRVSGDLFVKGLYDRAVIDRVIRFQAHLPSKMW